MVDNLIKASGELGANVVLLSRPFDAGAVLGGRSRSLDVYAIEPLKGKKAVEFLSRVFGQIDVKSKIITDLSKSTLLRALDGAPIAYILLGRLMAENQQDLPSNLTELFQKYCEMVLGRWEMAKGLRSQQEYEVMVEFLIWMSTYLLENQIDEIARSELEAWVYQYCKKRGLAINASSLVEKACHRNSILYMRSDVGVVGFRHRAFCEFFYAKKLDKNQDVELSGDVFSPYWLNSYYFLAGIKRDCPDLLMSLLEMDLGNESYRLMRALNFGNFLLAGYLTPQDVCKKSVLKMADEMSSFFISASEPSSESPLTQLPTIQLLCALANAYSDQYGYKFFKSSLEEAIFEAEDSELTDKSALSLFFLDKAYKDAGGDLRFDSLLDKYGDSLPLVIKIAIHHESDRMSEMSDRVKKMERNLRRSLSSRPGGKDFLNKLYRVPIKNLEKKLI